LGLKDLQRWLNNNKAQGYSNITNNSTVVEESRKEIQSLQRERFKIFHNKPFYISDIEEHKAEDKRTGGKCCFNHIIGLPKKANVEKPIFDYEMNLFNALQKHDDIWIKKARGLGITEILLRYMSWLALRNSDYNGKRFHIVTGPRIDLAEELINRIRLFLLHQHDLKFKFSSVFFFCCHIIPSHIIGSPLLLLCNVYLQSVYMNDKGRGQYQ
jgi:hypothetical protein